MTKIEELKEREKLEDMIVRLQIDFNKALFSDAYSIALEIYHVDKEVGYKYVTILNRYWGYKRIND